MGKPEHELSIGEILELAFNLYTKNFLVFFFPILIMMVFSGIVSAVVASFVNEALSNMPMYGTLPEVLDWLTNFLQTFIPIALAATLLSWIISATTQGICVKCAADLIEKGRASLGEAVNFTIYKIFTLIIAVIVTNLLIVLGCLALIIPGILLAIMFYLVIPVIVVEDIGVLDSISRSRTLVGNRWLKTFAIALILGIVSMLAYYIGNLIGRPLGTFNVVVGSVISAFVQPIVVISATVYYYAMLAKEAKMKLPPPPPPPF